MRRSSQSGITLIELMIVVAIIAILAGVAVPLFMKSQKKAKAAEVAAIFTEFKLREEGFYNENGRYLSTGGYPNPAAPDETDKHPAVPAGPSKPVPIAPLPDSWKALRLQTDKQNLYCSYVSIAGDADDPANLGAVATSFDMTVAPKTDWYYLIAECDFDGDVATNSFYFTNSENDRIAVQDEGK